MNQIHLNKIIDVELAGLRLDQALAKLFPQFSRSQLQQRVLDGKVSVDKEIIRRNKDRIYPGQTIELNTELQDKDEWLPEQIPLDIVFQDEALLVINKPPGLVVHPGAGNPSATLVNALLHADPQLQKIPRAGLIHRLDKDTSGLLLIARTLTAHHFLIKQMQERHIHRSYLAIVVGHVKPEGTIDVAIGRHPSQRTKMAVLGQSGKRAITHYRLIKNFTSHSYLEVELETGRTHQIRVHMAYINHPILGDPVYGKQHRFPHLSEMLQAKIGDFKRQALHAKKLSFVHPITNELLTFEAPPPIDFIELLQAFEED